MSGEIIEAMKRDDFDASLRLALPVLSAEGGRIGRLVPVGSWILEEHAIIEALTAWRRRWSRMFFSRFEPTAERTAAYLRNLAIEGPDRLMFLIYTDDDRFVGHTGIANVAGSTGDLDNIVRGVSGGHPRLMPFASVAVLEWCFGELGLGGMNGRVMSFNRPIISLLKQIGFEAVETLPLFERKAGDTTFHDFVEPGQSNVDYSCTRFFLDRDTFRRKAALLRSTGSSQADASDV